MLRGMELATELLLLAGGFSFLEISPPRAGSRKIVFIFSQKKMKIEKLETQNILVCVVGFLVFVGIHAKIFIIVRIRLNAVAKHFTTYRGFWCASGANLSEN